MTGEKVAFDKDDLDKWVEKLKPYTPIFFENNTLEWRGIDKEVLRGETCNLATCRKRIPYYPDIDEYYEEEERRGEEDEYGGPNNYLAPDG